MLKDAYKNISKVYDFIVEPFLSGFKRSTVKILLEEFNLSPTIRVLDAACGTGTLASMLTRKGFAVFALEKAPGMIKQTLKKARIGGNRLFPFCADAGDIPTASKIFDTVIIQMTLHELSEKHRQACALELKRVAKDNAVFVFVDFMPAQKLTLSNCLILLAERAAGIDHYRNGRKFLNKGGLIRFLRRNEFKIIKTLYFLQGNLCLAVATKQYAK